MNKLLLTGLITCLSMASFAQSAKEKIDKVAKDPMTKENAAKADVRLHDKKIIADSSSITATQNPAKKKKKNCKSGRNK